MHAFIVIYGSHYGKTEKYARAIAAALGCPALSAKEVRTADLAGKTVVFGGGVYAGSICGWKRTAKKIAKAKAPRLVLFVCGLADPAKQKTRDEARMLFEKKCAAAKDAPVFCLRGGIDYGKLKFGHRTMMAMLMQYLKRKKDPSPEDAQLLATYGKAVDFYDESTAKAVIDAAKSL